MKVEGRLQGQYDQARLDLRFRRDAVEGCVENSVVDLHIDSGLMEGEANKNPVLIKHSWIPDHAHYHGKANGKEFELNVNYETSTAAGHNGAEAIDLKFDQNSVKGTAGGVVDLQLTGSKVSGVLCGRSLDAERENLDVGGLLTNIFLFTPAQQGSSNLGKAW